MTDLITESQEHLQKEKMEALVKQYGPWVLGFVFIFILVVAISQAFSAWNNGILEKQTSLYINALDGQDIAEKSSKMRPYLANLALLSSNHSLSKNAPRDLRELSQISAPDVTLAQLEAIAGRSSSPWRSRAYLRAAIMVAEKDLPKTKEYLKQVIVDENAPITLKNRAQELLDLYNLEGKQIVPLVVKAPDNSSTESSNDALDSNAPPLPAKKPKVPKGV